MSSLKLNYDDFIFKPFAGRPNTLGSTIKIDAFQAEVHVRSKSSLNTLIEGMMVPCSDKIQQHSGSAQKLSCSLPEKKSGFAERQVDHKNTDAIVNNEGLAENKHSFLQSMYEENTTLKAENLIKRKMKGSKKKNSINHKDFILSRGVLAERDPNIKSNRLKKSYVSTSKKKQNSVNRKITSLNPKIIVEQQYQLKINNNSISIPRTISRELLELKEKHVNILKNQKTIRQKPKNKYQSFSYDFDSLLKAQYVPSKLDKADSKLTCKKRAKREINSKFHQLSRNNVIQCKFNKSPPPNQLPQVYPSHIKTMTNSEYPIQQSGLIDDSVYDINRDESIDSCNSNHESAVIKSRA